MVESVGVVQGAPVEACVLSHSPSPVPAAVAAAVAKVLHCWTAMSRSTSGHTVAPPYTPDLATSAYTQ